MREIRTYLNKFQVELDPDYLIDRMILHCGFWEQRVIGYLNNFVKPAMIVVDVGANAGYHTLLMADLVGQSGKVLAFEPNPDARRRLLRNLEMNPELRSRVQIYNEGLGAREEVLFIQPEIDPLHRGNASLVRGAVSDAASEARVVRLDDFVTQPISLIKIDVEGMELQVLEGGTKHLVNDRPVVVFETLRCVPPERHKPVEEFLRDLGYRIFASTPDGTSLQEITYPNYPYDDSVAIFWGAR